MSSKNPKHTHKYFRANMQFGRVWACALSNCQHYMPKHMEDILPGKNTECWSCGERTTMDSRTMAMEKPLCENCDTSFARILENPLVSEVNCSKCGEAIIGDPSSGLCILCRISKVG